MNETLGKWGRVVAVLASLVAWQAGARAQVAVVVGTDNPIVDILAVQAAVDHGGRVLLKGHFSFDLAPTQPMPPALATASTGAYPPATILVSKAVIITGTDDDSGGTTTIDAGTIPFFVNAPGADVAIQELRFVNPSTEAILVYAVAGLAISSCRIEGVRPLAIFGSTAIDINTSGGVPTPANEGTPANVSGPLFIVDNDIDVAGGTSQDLTTGINIWSVGVTGAEVETHISGNTIKNFNEKAVNLRRILGQVYVEQNDVTSDTVMGPSKGPGAIFVANLGSYMVEHNHVHVRWTSPGYGIDLRGQVKGKWPAAGAIVADNEVNMDAPVGTVFATTDPSAGIAVEGNANNNIVLKNRIEGRAKAGVAVTPFTNASGVVTGVPADNAVVLNVFDDFVPSVDYVLDQGVGTVIVPGPH